MIVHCKNIISSHGKTDLQKIKSYSLLVKSPQKTKQSEFAAVNNYMKKISFWKLFTERSICERKTYEIKDLGFHT